MTDEEIKIHEETLIQTILNAKGPKKRQYITSMMESMKDTVHKMVLLQVGMMISIAINIILILILIMK